MDFFTKFRKACLLLCFFGLSLSSCEKEKREWPLLPPDPEKETDVTNLGVLTVSNENSGGKTANEGSSRLVDGDLGSKFLINPYVNTLTATITFVKSQRVSAYALTSGNDAPDRDPKNWTLQASTDNTTWVTLDTRTNETFATRKLTKRYDFTNTKEYKYYKLSITANNGGGLFQLAEWGLIRVPQ